MSENRKLMRYVFYKADRAWLRLPAEERSIHKKELADLVGRAGIEIHSYSTLGLRGDCDFGFWLLADSAEEVSDFQASFNGLQMAGFLDAGHSFLAMTRKSQYLKDHKHAGQEADKPAGPEGGRYLFVYPMDKQRRWYSLDFEERRKIMGEHFRIGHKYPGVKIHTGYSFGIDDQEFVVAFEADTLGEFLDLVEELRGSESSSFTARDVPIITGIAKPIGEILDQLDGASS